MQAFRAKTSTRLQARPHQGGKDQCMLMARMLFAFKVQIDVIVASR